MFRVGDKVINDCTCGSCVRGGTGIVIGVIEGGIRVEWEDEGSYEYLPICLILPYYKPGQQIEMEL